MQFAVVKQPTILLDLQFMSPGVSLTTSYEDVSSNNEGGLVFQCLLLNMEVHVYEWKDFF